jgi:sortase A
VSHARSRARRWLEGILLFGGLAAILVSAWFLGGAVLWRKWQDQKFDEAQKAAQTESPQAEPAPTPAPPPPPPAPGDVIGRLSIARLNVKSVVREGTTDSVLSMALGHIEGTAMPGQVGNVGVAGHRDTLFRGLRNVALKDQIVLESVNKKYTYHVESTQVVKPTDVQVLDPTPNASELTLVTCFPFDYVGSAPNRFIVKAKLVPEVTAAKAPAAPIQEVTAAKTPPAPIQPPKPELTRVQPPKPRLTTVALNPEPTVKPASYRPPRPSLYQASSLKPEPPEFKPEPPAFRSPETRFPEPKSSSPSRVSFSVTAGHSRELVPNQVWFGLSRSDGHEADGWLWIAPERRTVWLRDAEQGHAIPFRNGSKEYELVITKRSSGSVDGYIVAPRS